MKAQSCKATTRTQPSVKPQSKLDLVSEKGFQIEESILLRAKAGHRFRMAAREACKVSV